jgi:hypothetical protein
MKHKRKNSKRVLARKQLPPQSSVGEWSRMLHKSWMIDVIDKLNFKKKSWEDNV